MFGKYYFKSDYTNDKVITNETNLIKEDEIDDIAKVSKSEKAYERMIYFCETKKLEYIVIDTSNKTPEETVDLIMKRIEELK